MQESADCFVAVAPRNDGEEGGTTEFTENTEDV